MTENTTLDWNGGFGFRTDHAITTSDGLVEFADIQDMHKTDPSTSTGRGITVVVMDSGIDDTLSVFDGMSVEHVDIAGENLDSKDAVGHGTACAGLIAEIAPSVELISLRIFGDSGQSSGTDILKAYRWLLQNTDKYDVVNMSWGAQKRISQIDALHDKLVNKGVYTVVAAGNTGDKGGSPATARRAFSAGALTEDGTVTRFSSYNPTRDNPDVAALGKDVKLWRATGTSMGAVIDDTYVKASGTSFAAPIVTGLVARLLSANPDSHPAGALEQTARNIPETPEDGEGIADYRRATQIDADAPVPDISTSARVWPFFNNDIIKLNADWITSGKYTVEQVPDRGDGVVLRFIPK
jgi:subtilisin family serine protease